MAKQLTKQETYDLVASVIKWYDKYKSAMMSGVNRPILSRWICAIIEKESTRHVYAKNKKSTATGLTQVLNGTRLAREKALGVNFGDFNPTAYKNLANKHESMYNPFYAVLIGMAEYLYQFKRYGNDYYDACRAYNAGNAKGNAGKGYAESVNKFMGEYDFAQLEANSAVDVSANDAEQYNFARVEGKPGIPVAEFFPQVLQVDEINTKREAFF